GFGDRPTSSADPAPGLTLSPRIFTRDGRVVASRSYPLDAALPPHGRPEPAAADPENPGHFLIRRAHWASFFPERTLIAETGSVISLRVKNNLAQGHALQFLHAGPGGSHIGTGDIAPGGTATLEFQAPQPGTYVYCDPGADASDPKADPVQRILGLYGALLVVDPDRAWKIGPAGPEFERQWLWILHNVDPEWARIASRGEEVDPVKTPFYSRYFTLNGRSGFQSLGISADKEANLVRAEETMMSGFPRKVDVRDFSQGATGDTVRTGQLLRFINAGMVDHQLHFHGNHIWTVQKNGIMFPRTHGRVDPGGHVELQQWEDVVELHTLERKDSILPFKRPPEVTDQVWNSRSVEWLYPMHCHAEASQVAMGGMYPGGLVG
ncbi:copper resistance protein, partial [Arthrobacter sp. PO-11]|nr:copper resistance protein [Arthrobacter cavernae]